MIPVTRIAPRANERPTIIPWQSTPPRLPHFMEPEAEVGLGVELRSTVAELANSTVSVVDTVPYRAWVSVKPLVPLAAMAESVSVAVSPESDATVQSITKLPMVRELMTMEDVGTPRIRAKSCFSAAISSARRLFNSD